MSSLFVLTFCGRNQSRHVSTADAPVALEHTAIKTLTLLPRDFEGRCGASHHHGHPWPAGWALGGAFYYRIARLRCTFGVVSDDLEGVASVCSQLLHLRSWGLDL